MSISSKKCFTRLGAAAVMIAALADAAGGAPSGLAAPSGRTETSQDMELLLSDQIFVTTATKTTGRISDSPAAVTVITEDQIRASGARTITDLLRSAPGVDVMDVNNTQSNVSIRGFNDQLTNKLLVMVDGRSIYQDFYGAVFWAQEPLLVSRIKQIEIVRGPGSALYGANAFDGVVNIITKTPLEMATEAKSGFTAARGSENANSMEAYAAGKAGAWSYSFGAGYNSSDGYGNQEQPKVPDSNSTNILMADAQRAMPRGVLRLSVNTNDTKTDFNSVFFVPNSDWLSRNYTISYGEAGVRNPVQVRAFLNTLDLTNPGQFDIHSNTYDLEIQQQRTVSDRHQLVYGVNYRRAEVNALLTSDRTKSRSSWSGFLQDEARLGARTNLFAGVRLDHDSQYGANLSPHLSLVHHLPKNQTVRVSYSSAFRAPTLFDNYLDFSTEIIPSVLSVNLVGNPNVRPEKIRTLEIGYRRDFHEGYVGVSAFYNQISDMMYIFPTEYAPSPPFPANTGVLYTSLNTGGAHAAGLELEGAFRVARGVKGLFNYAYQDVADDQRNPISYSPHHKANLTLASIGPSRFTWDADIHYVGSSILRDVFHANTEYDIAPYVRADVKIGYKLGSGDRSWRLFAAATNLLGDGHRELPQVPSAFSDTPQAAAARRVIWLGIESR
ncbi:MAG: TonB-dependent receptor [Capsulimonas sp.]|uniref:TonB-dependent receptor plug domain-containing protein n=1 Tax=Capsulimonas sp. TaxID=2494211 RepID=UPI003266D872